MATKEKIVVKEVFWILSLIAFLVFCSFLVNFRLVDALYLVAIGIYAVHYALGK